MASRVPGVAIFLAPILAVFLLASPCWSAGLGHMPEIPTLRAEELFLRSQPRHLPAVVSETIIPSDHSAPQNPETTREIRRILLEAITITRWSASQLAVTDRRFAR